MFNRPEMIPSQRMLRQTAVERLEQMRATALNAKEAEDLLRCLVVAQGPFNRSAIAALAPQTMDTPTRNRAFSTLRSSNIVQRFSVKRYKIRDSIKRLYPPSQELLARHYAHFSRLSDEFGHNHNLIHNYWSDVSAALLWGLEHQPETTLEISIVIFYSSFYFDYSPLFTPLIYEAALQTNHIPMKAFAFKEMGEQAHRKEDLASADAWFEQSLALYTQLGDRDEQASIYFHRAQVARHAHDIPLARDYFAQSMAITGSREHYVLREVFNMEAEAGNLDEAYAVLPELLAEAQRIQQARYIVIFAQLLQRHSLYEEARDAFADAHLIMTQSGDPAYFAWETLLACSQMEHQAGNLKVGCNLCRLALVELWDIEDDMEIYKIPRNIDWRRGKGVEIRAALAAMGCEDC